MIVRWGIDELPGVLAELGVERAVLVTSERFAGLDLPAAVRFTGVRPHSPVDVVAAATSAAGSADGVIGLGGGSAIDTSKAVAAAEGLPLVAVPTTYAGAEWTPYYGMRDEARRVKAGGSGAGTAAIVYEPALTLDLPREETVGTAMNALAHCAEAYYAPGADDRAAPAADTGAALIAAALPHVVREPGSLEGRSRLLEGAMHAALALGFSGLCLAHAMAQGLGGHFGLPQGAMNAICLPAALRFNVEAVPDAIARFAAALGTDDAPARCAELAALGGFRRLRDEGVPEHELAEVAAAITERPGTRANPRPVAAADVERLLREVW